MKGAFTMKEIVKTNRLAGQLEKLYNKLNADFFGGALEPRSSRFKAQKTATSHLRRTRQNLKKVHKVRIPKYSWYFRGDKFGN